MKVDNSIKEIRKQLNCTQSEFAKHFNIPVGTIHNWEQGIRKPPDYVVEMIQKIINYELINNS